MSSSKEKERVSVPRWWKNSIAGQYSIIENCLFCTLVLSNVALFGFANKSTGTWVRVAIELEGEGDKDPVYEANIFTLGTFSTIKDFWRSGAHATAIVTGITAGALPYVILGSCLLLWFGPYYDLRGFLCSFLVHLVRFEHMLTMAAILLCVALKVDVPLGNEAMVKLRTIFGWGTFAFEMAAIFSYFITLFLCYAHSQSEITEKKKNTFHQDDRAMACVGIQPNRLHRNSQSRLLLPMIKHKFILSILAVANIFITMFALVFPSIRFTVRDLAKDFVQVKRRRFSILGTVMAINGSTRRAEAKAFWCSWLGIFCVALPFLSALYFFIVLLLPTKNFRFRLFFFALHGHALASADVWFIVLANFAKNIDIISKWIVNDQAEHLCDQIKADTRFDGCMEVTGFPLHGFWWLGAHTILNNALHIILYCAIYPYHTPPRIRKFLFITSSDCVNEHLSDSTTLENPLLPQEDIINTDPSVLVTSSTTPNRLLEEDDDNEEQGSVPSIPLRSTSHATNSPISASS